MPTAIVSLRDVAKTYDRSDSRIAVLTGVSLDVREGESVAIEGTSGSGKSTLLRVLALLEPPTSGHVEIAGVEGRSMWGPTLARFRRRTFGLVLKDAPLPSRRSLLATVTPARTAMSAGRRQRIQLGTAVLHELTLDGRGRCPVGSLSSGERQLARIARAVSHGPRILLAEEPFADLDDEGAAAAEELLFRLNREHGITLLLVTRDRALAARCDRRMRLHDGRLVPASAPVAA